MALYSQVPFQTAGDDPQIQEINLPLLELLPDVVFETFHQALGKQDWLQEVCNSLPSQVQFQAQLAKTFI